MNATPSVVAEPAILVVTGASGAGKSTLVRRLAALRAHEQLAQCFRGLLIRWEVKACNYLALVYLASAAHQQSR
jgi:ABC-type polar amino acid transport system ATPase subunit